jgi:hypothetical protein
MLRLAISFNQILCNFTALKIIPNPLVNLFKNTNSYAKRHHKNRFHISRT